MTARSTTVRDRDRRAIARTKPPCGICSEPIDYTLRSPDPKSYVVDHIVPLNKGGTDTLDNKQAAHRDCNRTKSDDIEGRKVILICGHPGAGKTTLARSLGLPVFDVDEPEWAGDETAFRSALTRLGRDPHAHAAVIRSAATLDARRKAALLCGATHVRVIDTDLATCITRIRERRRTTPPIKTQIAAAQGWWAKYEPGLIELATARHFVTARTW